MWAFDAPKTGWTSECAWEKGHDTVCRTDGTNLLAVMAHDDVDHTRTTSNSVMEVFEVWTLCQC